jgi:hypothetical protein
MEQTHMQTKSNLLLFSLLLGGLASCDVGSKLPGIDITGTLKVDGDTPSAYSFTLYTWSDNKSAFDTSYCPEGLGADCYGRVNVRALNTPAVDDAGNPPSVTVDGKNFTIVDAPLDLAYILVVTGDDDTVVCSTDILGFDEDTKVMTSESAITLFSDSDLTSVDLPRPARLSCAAPVTEPAPPEDVVEEEPPVPDDEDIPAGEDPEAYWAEFTITNKAGTTTYADASLGSVEADVSCGADFPSVLQVHGTAVNADASNAYIRIQFGSGADATYRTIETPIIGGVVDQAISLTGGYSVVQLDLDGDLNGEGESYTVSFCDRDAPPAQELLIILTWDKNDTDVDTHVYSSGTEVAYYSMSQSWGDLDIDDIDGFGPETFTSTTTTWGNIYDLRLHYYSDHRNGATTATVRVVYYDDSVGRICDMAASKLMNSYEWWSVGSFGPGMVCPE